MKSLKFVVLGAFAAALTACGGGDSISSKEDAAKAMNRLAYATNSAGANQSPGSNFGSEITVTVNGKQGTAKVTQTVEFGGSSGTVTQKIEYKDFSADDENVYNGTMTLKMDISGVGNSGSIKMTMTGNVSMEGEYESDTEFDISISMTATELASQNGAKVTMVMDGHVTADGTRFDYANESVSVEAHAD